jgi:hypothetical protein
MNYASVYLGLWEKNIVWKFRQNPWPILDL